MTYFLQEALASNANPSAVIPVQSFGREHDFENWAMKTATRLFVGNDGNKLEVAQLQLNVAKALFPHFEECLEQEKKSIVEDPDHLLKGFNIGDHASNALNDAIKVVLDIDNPSWNAAVTSVEGRTAALREIGSMLATVVNIERLWFADDNPDNESARHYKQKMNGV